MPLYSVKVKKTVVQEDEIVIRAEDAEEAKHLVKNLCFQDGYAGSLIGEKPRKLFSPYDRKNTTLEVLEVKKCLVQDDPESETPDRIEPNASISVE